MKNPHACTPAWNCLYFLILCALITFSMQFFAIRVSCVTNVVCEWSKSMVMSHLTVNLFNNNIVNMCVEKRRKKKQFTAWKVLISQTKTEVKWNSNTQKNSSLSHLDIPKKIKKIKKAKWRWVKKERERAQHLRGCQLCGNSNKYRWSLA